jgi:hypothetical protein
MSNRLWLRRNTAHPAITEAGVSPGGPVTVAVETLEQLIRLTDKNGHTVTLIFPEETGDFIRGYITGQLDALRLALEHVRDIASHR